MTHNPALAALRHRVAGAIERGEAAAIAEHRAPVDVLAVLQRQIDLALSCGNDERAEALQDIRAAIAELIEAAREGSATLGHIYHTTPLHPELEQYAHDGYQRLDAAIAGVSPPKAHKHCDHSWAVKMVTGGPVRVCQNCGLVPPDAALARVGGGK